MVTDMCLDVLFIFSGWQKFLGHKILSVAKDQKRQEPAPFSFYYFQSNGNIGKKLCRGTQDPTASPQHNNYLKTEQTRAKFGAGNKTCKEKLRSRRTQIKPGATEEKETQRNHPPPKPLWRGNWAWSVSWSSFKVSLSGQMSQSRSILMSLKDPSMFCMLSLSYSKIKRN